MKEYNPHTNDNVIYTPHSVANEVIVGGGLLLAAACVAATYVIAKAVASQPSIKRFGPSIDDIEQ